MKASLVETSTSHSDTDEDLKASHFPGMDRGKEKIYFEEYIARLTVTSNLPRIS